MKQVRCAIYTRKSSEEGLEQAFNSLDAQREACAAYILSQASEGWTALPDIYDDGGLSGGSLERPALQRLLAEVAAGRVDIIVVYKVDRLTRSLLDFSKLVEAFDKAGTSFVSVTQSFNTTTSMGRLTLNMLLSFAQFEREVTAERIRDKIAASKAKGMWMGGTPPIGYKPDGRSLAIVEEHAAIVRTIFERYLQLGNVRHVAVQLERDGIRSPERVSAKNGASYGGLPFSRGQIHSMLKCPTYVGEVHHKGQVYAGLHKGIIERDTWDRVQAMFAGNVQGGRRTRSPNTSLLAGKLVDQQDEPLIAVHATKGKVRYRYYVSRKLQQEPDATGMRIPARELETAVCQRVAGLFDDALALAAQASLNLRPDGIGAFAARCEIIAAKVKHADRELVAALIQQVRIHDQRIEVVCDTAGIADAVGVARDPEAPETLSLASDIRLTRSGRAMRLVQDNGAAVATISSASLIRLLLKARGWWAELKLGQLNVLELSARENVSAAYMTRVLRLAFLAPAVVEAILAGRVRSEVDAARLTATDAIPPGWAEQRRLLLPATG